MGALRFEVKPNVVNCPGAGVVGFIFTLSIEATDKIPFGKMVRLLNVPSEAKTPAPPIVVPVMDPPVMSTDEISTENPNSG